MTGTCLADVCHEVLCIDIDPAKVDLLNSGQVPIYEPWLAAMVARNREEGRLRFTTDTVEGVAFGTLQFIAVGMPPDEDGSADMQYVLDVAAIRNSSRKARPSRISPAARASWWAPIQTKCAS